jgi:hypothetical protein
MSIAGVPIPAKHGRINDLNAQNNYDEDENEYWSVSATIEVSKREIHKREFLNQTFMAFNLLNSPCYQVVIV